MLANILIPIALFCIALGAAYSVRGIGVWEVVASCIVAGIGSVATQAVTSTGLFAHPKSQGQEAKNNDEQLQKAKQEETMKNAERLQKSRDWLLKRWNSPRAAAEVTEKLLRDEPGLSADKHLMETVLVKAVDEDNAGAIKAVLQANPQLRTMDIHVSATTAPLVFSLLHDSPRGLEYVVKSFPDSLIQRNSDNHTPVVEAARSGCDEALLIIADESPSTLLQTDEKGRNVIYLLLKSYSSEEVVLGTVQYLLAKNPNLATLKDHEGRTVRDYLRQPGFVTFRDPSLFQKLLKVLDEAEGKSKASDANKQPTITKTVMLLPQLECCDVDTVDPRFVPLIPIPIARSRKTTPDKK